MSSTNRHAVYRPFIKAEFFAKVVKNNLSNAFCSRTIPQLYVYEMATQNHGPVRFGNNVKIQGRETKVPSLIC
jgi:hypothetical protein